MNKSATCGIIYSATQQLRYLIEAANSAYSVNEYLPDTEITLFTDMKDGIKDGPFDQVIQVDQRSRGDFSIGEGLLHKVESLSKSPYEKTIFLDTDSRVMSGEVIKLFSILDSYDIALRKANLKQSLSCKHYGHPMFYTGVIAYRKSEKVLQLFAEWKTLMRQHLELAMKKKINPPQYLSHLSDPELIQWILMNDQTALVRLLSPETNKFNLSVKILDKTWEWGPDEAPEDILPKLKIYTAASLFKVSDQEALEYLEGEE